MGKKGKSSGGRGGRAVSGMRTDIPMPSESDPMTRAAWAKRMVVATMHAGLFLLHYTSYAVDGGFDYPTDKGFAPRADDESLADFEKRRAATRAIIAVQARAGDWKELCAQELTYLYPSDAPIVCEFVIEQLGTWMAQRGGGSFIEVMDGSRRYFEALCPPRYLDTAYRVAAELLDAMVVDRLDALRPAVSRAARRDPVATIHVCAAMAAAGLMGLSDQDRANAQLELSAVVERCLSPRGNDR